MLSRQNNPRGLERMMVPLKLFLQSSRTLSRLRVATYYTKAKEKKKTSGQAWFLLAGVTTALSSAALYFLG